MNPYEELQKNLPEIEAILGTSFQNKKLLIEAFTHSSFINEHKDLEIKHNEQLEFLGDSVFNLIISEYLLLNKPDLSEGELSSLRSSIISAPSCLLFLQSIQVNQFLLVGKGEKLLSKTRKTSLFADLFEALIGALFLDAGYEKTKQIFFSLFAKALQAKIDQPAVNAKALLQEISQKTYHELPSYTIISEEGPEHEKHFTVGAFVANRLLGQGFGRSKKEAQQEAAKKALEQLKEEGEV